jgi:Amt family ammonium transporter
LDVGKIEAGIEMDLEPCELPPLIDDTLYLLMPQAKEKSIQLTSELDEDLPPIVANKIRIRQVIYNLVDNAVKFTPSQGRVTIRVFQQDHEIRMQVIDTGIGIPTADQARIFDKFHRVKHEYAADEAKGTGLGLAITKGIVEKHNGRIWLESMPGEGSTFTVVLPVPQELFDPA